MNNTSNCTDHFTKEQEKEMVLAIDVTAAISFMACCLTLFLIVFYQTFKTTLQRLFIYLTASVAVKLAVLAMQDYTNARYCAAIGFLNLYAGHIELCIRNGAIVYLLHYVRTSSPDQRRTRYSVKLRVLLEVTFILFSILFPLTYSWTPFIRDAYGKDPINPLCWVRTKKSDYSKIPAGHWYYTALVEIPLSATTVLDTILTLVIVGQYCKWACKYRNVKEVRKTLLHEAGATALLVVYFVFYSLIDILFFILWISKLHNYWLWIMAMILYPLSRLSIPVSFVVYLYLRRKEIKTARRAWKDYWNCCKSTATDGDSQEEEQPTFQRTLPANVPSSTCYHIPAEFTDECTEYSVLVSSKNLSVSYVNRYKYGGCINTL